MGRIIPARAGFTFVVSEQGGLRWDHPRSRGVYPMLSMAFWVIAGSSPLARSLPNQSRQNSEAARIIPARAGFTA